MESAVKEFDLISRKYNATPLKHVLMMKCIEQENWDNLEKIKNISSAIHGDARSLYDLLIAFVESENIEEAKKILKVRTFLYNFFFCMVNDIIFTVHCVILFS